VSLALVVVVYLAAFSPFAALGFQAPRDDCLTNEVSIKFELLPHQCQVYERIFWRAFFSLQMKYLHRTRYIIHTKLIVCQLIINVLREHKNFIIEGELF